MRDRPGPKKSLGQHFLVDRSARRRIVDALEATERDEVLEIGPGEGALTELLVGHVGRLVMVELDDRLASALDVRWGDRDDVEVVHADVLDRSIAELVQEPERFLVVGNLPYGITGPLFGRLMERPRPLRAVVMIQEEVGDRILAAPGGKSYGALSVGVRSVFEARKVMRVSRGAFRPVPGVDSVVVRLDRIDPAPLSEAEEGDLRTLVRASFQWRRKQLGTILRRHPDLKMWRSRVDAALADAGLESRIRPEGLAPDRFLHLLRNLSAPESGGSGVTR